MKLTKTIFLYLNEKEFSMLTKDAERANMSMSRYIRHQIDNAKMKPTLDMDYEKYINLLEPICDKLSIVSKRVWQIKMLDELDFLSFRITSRYIVTFSCIQNVRQKSNGLLI